MQYTAQHIAEILRTDYVARPELSIRLLLTDSRSLTYPDQTLFFALTTPTGDGHRYIADLYRRGVRNFVVRRRPDTADACYADANFFVVNDVRQALQLLARHHRALHQDMEIIGITGSRGKTTLKEWLNHLLSATTPTVRSPRSYNSQIGVPLSLWEIDDADRVGIFEAGISQRGEMSSLRDMIRPTIGIITNVGVEHADGFTSRSEKCNEKLLLFDHCPNIIYSTDDPMIVDCIETRFPRESLTSVSRIASNQADVNVTVSINRATSSSTVDYSSTRYGKSGVFSIPFTSEAAAANVSLALATLLVMGIDPISIADRFATLPQVNTRLNVAEGINDCTVITDRYASDYPSLATALDFMQRRRPKDTRTTVILSDMATNGHENSAQLYRYVDRLLARHHINRLIAVGQEISRHIDSFSSVEQCTACVDYADFVAKCAPSDFSHDLILIKGNGSPAIDKINEMLEGRHYETMLEVDLDAMVHNFNLFRSQLRPETGIVAMVKASGYGAGSYELARTLQSHGAAYLAVAVTDEAIELRNSGITMPIMVLNPKVTDYRTLFDHNLEPEIYSFDLLDQIIAEGQRCGVKGFPIHIKLDTGMHRLGFLEEDIPALIERLTDQDVVTPRSAFSHLAAADVPALDDFTREQFAKFERCSSQLKAVYPQMMRHILNSTGITRFPEYQYDMVRLGICLYGIPTLTDGSHDELQPVSSLYTVVISIKEWPTGTPIGYGCREILTRPSRIATIPIGYADGLRRALGCGRTKVWINGTLCPIVGNICMDICMVDVTDAVCAVGDRVEVFGHHVSVMDMADTLGTIPYEVLTSVSARVKRVYFRE